MVHRGNQWIKPLYPLTRLAGAPTHLSRGGWFRLGGAMHTQTQLLAVFLCSLASTNAYHLCAPGLRVSSRAPKMALEGESRPLVPVSRRGALLIPFLPVFSGVAQAKGDEKLSFSSEIAGSDGDGVSIAFAYPPSWKLEEKPGEILVTEAIVKACDEDPDRCDYGQIIARSIATGDNAIVVAAETDIELEQIPFSFFKKSIYGRGGKFGAYGEPADVKPVADSTTNGVRMIEVKWSTFTPGGSTLAKRSIISVVSIADAVYMLVCSSSAKSYKSSEPILRSVAASWRATATGKPARKAEKIDGVKASMFKKQNDERKALQAEREAEGIF